MTAAPITRQPSAICPDHDAVHEWHGTPCPEDRAERPTSWRDLAIGAAIGFGAAGMLFALMGRV